VRAVVAPRRQGLASLIAALGATAGCGPPPPAWSVPPEIAAETEPLVQELLRERALPARAAFAEAVSLLMQATEGAPTEHLGPSARTMVRETRERLADSEVDFASLAIEARYAWIARVCADVTHQAVRPRR